MKKQFLNWLVVAGIFVFSIGCSEDEKNARLEVWLTDGPGDYDEVNIDVQGVEIHADANDNGQGWQALDINTGVYNLLELTNGLDTLLGDIELPAGKVSQIRLILGDDNSLRIGDNVYDLETPSGQQSGLKLQVHETLTEGITYKITLDFDVAQSIVETGNGDYQLKPVIRSITEAQDGAIKGSVDPKESTPAIYAVLNGDTLATTFTDTTSGEFLLRGLPAGSYQVLFSPNSSYQQTEKTGVAVTIGNVTDVGVVTIQPQ